MRKFKIFDEITEEYLGVILNFVDNLMQDIEFGMFDENGEELLNSEDWYDKTVVQSPEDTINHKKGNSVDQANLLYWLFKDNGLKPEIYYVEYTNKDKVSPSHMFVIFNKDNKCYWYENAWEDEKGLHDFNNSIECFDYIKSKFCPSEYSNTCKVYQIKDLKEGTNPNQVLNRKIVRINDKPNVVFLSEKEISPEEDVLPTIPNNFLTEYGYEDIIQERITVYPSIKDALYTDTITNLKNKEFNVYSPIYNCTLYKPSLEENPTSKITNEIWIYEPIKVQKIGKIKVKNANKDYEPEYKYGENNIGKMKQWDYEILEGNLVKDSAAKKKKSYCVIDSNKKIVFEDNYTKCNEYVKIKGINDLKCILKDTYKLINDKSLEYMFKDQKYGLKIVYGNDSNYNCINVKVIDCQTNEEIDSELCYDKGEAKYIIDCFRQQYKIRKVEKRND